MWARLVRWVRKFRCSMNIGHRVQEKWWAMDVNSFHVSMQVRLYECQVKDGKVQYFQCVDCGAYIAPFEQRQRKWEVVA